MIGKEGSPIDAKAGDIPARLSVMNGRGMQPKKRDDAGLAQDSPRRNGFRRAPTGVILCQEHCCFLISTAL